MLRPYLLYLACGWRQEATEWVRQVLLPREPSPGGIAFTLKEFRTQFQKTSYGPPKRNSHCPERKRECVQGQGGKTWEGRKVQRQPPRGGSGDLRSSSPGLGLCTEAAGSISDRMGTVNKRVGVGKFKVCLGWGVLIMRRALHVWEQGLWGKFPYCSVLQWIWKCPENKSLYKMNLAIVNTTKFYNYGCRRIIRLRGEHLWRRMGEIRLLISMSVNGFLHSFYKWFF